MKKIIYKILGQPIDPKKGIRGTSSGKLYIDKKVFFQRDDVKDTIDKIKKAKHYNTYDIETIDIMEKVFGVEKLIIWCTITAFKYRMRMGKKDSVNDDLFKENWYLEKAKELKNKP